MLSEGEFRLFDFGMPVFLRLDRDPAEVVALVEQLKHLPDWNLALAEERKQPAVIAF